MLRSYDEGTHIAESSMDATALLALYGTLRLTFSGSDRWINCRASIIARVLRSSSSCEIQTPISTFKRSSLVDVVQARIHLIIDRI
jgi:hypothetical protein